MCYYMLYVGYLKYVLQHVPFLLLKNEKMGLTTSSLLLPSFGAYTYILYLRYSYFFKKFFLLDIGGYDVPRFGDSGNAVTSGVEYSPVLWYLFKCVSGCRYFLFSLQLSGSRFFQSIELLFRNARWLEREASEFFGFFFSTKVDRRALFTIPLFYNNPFRKKYPVVGFYEVFFCPLLKKLKFKHISLQI